MAENKYNELLVLKRLVNIQKIHDAFKQNQDVQKFANKDKIAYILWQDSSSRNSDIYLAIQFYKKFYPEYVKDNILKLDDLFKIPKMYDIQRTRAEIQNSEGLFPATDEVRKNRAKREAEFNTYYRETKRKTLKALPDYYIYFDESGKTDKYFVLAGVLLNGESNNNAQRLRFNKLKKSLSEKHNLTINELKFTDIKQRNLVFYKELLDIAFKDGSPFVFVSILVENSGLKRNSEKNKTKELLEILLKGQLASLLVRATCSSPYASNKAKINIIQDKDGSGRDIMQSENIRLRIDSQLKQSYRYLIQLESLIDVDSKENILVQLADLYASSINNVFSELPDNSESAKCRKEFAKYFLEKIGLKKITQEFSDKKSNIKFINKVIATNKQEKSSPKDNN